MSTQIDSNSIYPFRAWFLTPLGDDSHVTWYVDSYWFTLVPAQFLSSLSLSFSRARFNSERRAPDARFSPACFTPCSNTQFVNKQNSSIKIIFFDKTTFYLLIISRFHEVVILSIFYMPCAMGSLELREIHMVQVMLAELLGPKAVPNPPAIVTL